MGLQHLLNFEGLIEGVNVVVGLVALYFAFQVLRHVNLSFQKRSWLLLSISAVLFAVGEIVGVLREFSIFEFNGLYELTQFGFALIFCAGFYYLMVSERLEIYRLKKSSATDGLTALYNHSFFEKYLLARVSSAKEPTSALSLLFMDIDNFKQYNDSYGHDAGNVVLQKVAEVIVQQARGTDLVARYGGEEFAVILNTGPLVAAKIAERIRSAIESALRPGSDPAIKRQITVSIGCASFGADGLTAADLVRTADARMYVAKSLGRNCVCSTSPVEPTGVGSISSQTSLTEAH